MNKSNEPRYSHTRHPNLHRRGRVARSHHHRKEEEEEEEEQSVLPQFVSELYPDDTVSESVYNNIKNVTLNTVNYFHLKAFHLIYQNLKLKKVYFNMQAFANLFNCLLQGAQCDKHVFCQQFRNELLPIMLEHQRDYTPTDSVTGLIYKNDDRSRLVHNELRQIDNFIDYELTKFKKTPEDFRNYLKKRVKQFDFLLTHEYVDLLLSGDFNFFSKVIFNIEWKYPFVANRLMFDDFYLRNNQSMKLYYRVMRNPTVKMGVFNSKKSDEKFTIMHIPYKNPNYSMFIWLPHRERDLKQLAAAFYRCLPRLTDFMSEDAFPEVELNSLYVPEDAFDINSTLGNMGSKLLKNLNQAMNCHFGEQLKYRHIFNGGASQFDINSTTLGMQSIIINPHQVINDPNRLRYETANKTDEKTIVLNSPFTFMNLGRDSNRDPIILDIGMYYPHLTGTQRYNVGCVPNTMKVEHEKVDIFK